MKKLFLFINICIYAVFATPNPASSSNDTTSSISAQAKILLTDGQSITGKIIGNQGAAITLQIDSGFITIDKDIIDTIKTIEQISKNGKLMDKDPSSTRYLYSPSAFMLKEGEASFSQKQLFFSSFAYGVTDYLSVQIGSAIPLLFVKDARNVLGGIKLGTSIIDNVHIGGGVQSFIVNGNVLAMPFGTLTFGTNHTHLSLNAGKPFFKDSEWESSDPFYSLSATHRLSKNTALVTENCFFPRDNEATVVIFSGALRIISNKLVTDLGLLFEKDFEFPIPWLDFTYHFGI